MQSGRLVVITDRFKIIIIKEQRKKRLEEFSIKTNRKMWIIKTYV